MRRSVELRISGFEAGFLQVYGAESFQGDFATAKERRREYLTRSKLPTVYDVIEESTRRVIVQVSPVTHWPEAMAVPSRTSRIHLIADEIGWQIAEIFIQCISCNSSGHGSRHPPSQTPSSRSSRVSHCFSAKAAGPTRELGKCFLCRGRGIGRDYCGGTGVCKVCATGLPGWCRVFSMGGLT